MEVRPKIMISEGDAKNVVRVLAIHGSPRKNGNTDILLERILTGASDAGAEVSHIRAAGLKISPCVGCGGCEKKGRCVIDDAMQDVYPQLEYSHRIIVSSPVYFYGVTAQLKVLIDRCQVFWSRKYLGFEPPPVRIDGIERKGLVVSVAATKGAKVFDGVLLTAKIFFDALNIDTVEEILIRGVDHKGDILKRQDVLENAYESGKRLGSAVE